MSQYKYRPSLRHRARTVTKDNIEAILKREQVWTDRRGEAASIDEPSAISRQLPVVIRSRWHGVDPKLTLADC